MAISKKQKRFLYAAAGVVCLGAIGGVGYAIYQKSTSAKDADKNVVLRLANNDPSKKEKSQQVMLRKKAFASTSDFKFYSLTQETSYTDGEVMVKTGDIGTKWTLTFRMRVFLSPAVAASGAVIGDALGVMMHIQPDAKMDHNFGLHVAFNSHLNPRVIIANNTETPLVEVPQKIVSTGEWLPVSITRDGNTLEILMHEPYLQVFKREIPGLISGGSWVKFYGWSGSAKAIQEIRDIELVKNK